MKRFRALKYIAAAVVFAVCSGAWGATSSQMPNNDSAYFNVCGSTGVGTLDLNTVIFLEVPSTATTPFYVWINSKEPGNTIPDSGTGGTATYTIYGGTGAYTPSSTRLLYGGTYATGTTLWSGTYAFQATATSWTCVNPAAPIDPASGELVGNKRYFKLLVTQNGDTNMKNAFQVDVSYSPTSRNGISSFNFFAYSWPLTLINLTTYELYPAVPAGTTGKNLIIGDWDSDMNDFGGGTTTALTIYSGIAKTAPALSIASLRWRYNAALVDSGQDNQTWKFTINSKQTDVNPAEFWAFVGTDSTTAADQSIAVPTSVLLVPIYASAKSSLPTPDHVIATVTPSSTTTGGSTLLVNLQIVDASGTPVTASNNVSVTLGSANVALVASNNNVALSGQTTTVTTDGFGAGWFTVYCPSVAGSYTATLVSTGLTHATADDMPSLVFTTVPVPTITSASSSSYAVGSAASLTNITVAEQAGGPCLTAGSTLLVRISSTLNAQFDTGVTPGGTVMTTGGATATYQNYANTGSGSAILKLTLANSLAASTSYTLTGLTLTAASLAASSGYLAFSVDNGATWTNDTGLIRITDPNLNIWTGGAGTPNWADIANWSNNAVPTSAQTVYIPAGLTNYPVLSGSDSVALKTLVIDSGASIDLGTETIDLSAQAAINGTVTNGTFRYASAVNLSGTVKSGGMNLVFDAPVTLTGDTTIDSAGGTITFNAGATINGAYSLTVSSGAGAKAFASVIGGGTPLKSLTVNGTGLATLSSASYKITGNTTTFNSAVKISATQTIQDAGEIIFNSTLAVDASVILTLQGLDVDFAAAVTAGSGAYLTIEPYTPANAVYLGAAADAGARLDVNAAEWGRLTSAAFAGITLGTSSSTVQAVGTATVSNVTIPGNLEVVTGTLTLGTALAVSGTITVDASQTLDLATYAVTGAMTFTNNGTVRISAGSQTIDGAKTNDALSTVIYYGTGTTGMNWGQIYNNLTIDATATGTFIPSGGLTIAGNLAINAATVKLTDANTSVTGNLTGAGTLDATSFAAGSSVSIGGNWTITNFTRGISTVAFTTTTTSITGATTFYDVSVTGSVTLDSAIVVNSLSIGAAGSLSAAGNQIQVYGNWTNNHTLAGFTHGSGTVIFVNDATHTTHTITGDTTFYSLTSTTTIPATIQFTTSSTTTIAAGGTLNFSGQSLSTLLTLTGSGTWNFDMQSAVTPTLAYLSIDYSDLLSRPLTATSSTDGGHNDAVETTVKWIFSTSYTWLGTDGTNPTYWSVGANWSPISPSGGPGSTDKITIPNTGNKPVMDAGTLPVVTVTVDTISIASGSSLALQGHNLTVTTTASKAASSTLYLYGGEAVTTPTADYLISTGITEYNGTAASYSIAQGMFTTLIVNSANASYTFTNAVTATTVILTNALSTGSVAFDGGLSATTLTSAAAGFGVSVGAGIGAQTSAVTTATLSNTGGLILGNEIGDSVTFTNGLSYTAGATHLAGTVKTDGAATHNIALAAVVLDAATLLDAGAAGTIAATGTVTNTASQNLTITNSAGTTFTGAVGTSGIPLGTVTLTATTGTIAFNGGLFANTLATASSGYALTLKGGTIGASVSFDNMGALSFDGATNGTLTFTGGVTAASSPASITLGGTIAATDNPLNLNKAVTLGSNTTVSAGTGTISLGGTVSGASTYTLTINSCSAASGTGGNISGLTGLTLDSGNLFTLAGTLAVTGNVTLTSGTLTLADFAGTQTITGNVSGSGGTLDAHLIVAGHTLAVSGYIGTTGTPLANFTAPAGTVQVGTNWNTSATFTHSSGTVEFTGNGIIYSSSGFYNLVKSGSGTTTSFSGAYLSVGNDLTVTLGTLTLDDSATTQSVTGNVSGTGTLDAHLIAAGHILSVGGYLGTTGIPLAIFTAPAGTAQVGTDWNVGTTFTHSSGTIEFTGNGTLYTAGGNFAALTKSGSGKLTTLNTGITVTGTMTLTDGTLAGGTTTLVSQGDINRTSGVLTFTAGGILRLNGATATTVHLSTSAIRNLDVQNTNASGAALAEDLAVLQNLTVNAAGRVFSTGAHNLAVTGNADFSNGTINLASGGIFAVAGTLTIAGTTVNNGSGSTLRLNAAAAQAINSDTGTRDFGSIDVATSGTAVTLTGNLNGTDLTTANATTFTVGSATATASVLTLTGTGTVMTTGTSGGVRWNGAAADSTITFTGTSPVISNGYNAGLQITSSVNTALLSATGTNPVDLTGSELSLNGHALSISRLTTAVPHTLLANETLTLTGNATFSNATSGLTLSGAGAAVIVGANTLTVKNPTVTTGTMSVSTGSIAAGASTLTVGSGGTLNATGTGGVTAGVFSNAGSATWSGGGTATFASVSNTGTIAFTTTATSAWTVNGNFTSTSSGIITNTFANTIAVAGNLDISGTFGGTKTNSTITMSGAAATITTTTQIGNLILASTATGETLLTDPLILAGTLDLQSSSVLGAGALGITVAGTTTIDGTLNAGSGADSFAAIGGSGILNATTNAAGTTISGNMSVATFNHNSGTVKFTGGTTGAYAFNNVIIAGTVTSGGIWTMAGNLTITSGVWTAGSFAHTIAGNWTNSAGTAGFVNTGATIVFTGAVTHTISGATNFLNLTDTTAGSTLTFTTGQIFGVSGLLTLTGSFANLITVQSSSLGSTWSLNNTGGTNVVSFVHVYDSPATASVNAANSICATNNNTNWIFTAITWRTIGTTDANLSSNWSTGVTPGQYDTVTIPAGGFQPVQSAPISFKGMTLSAAGSTWSNNNQDLTVGTSGVSNAGTFTYTGTGTLALNTAIFGGTFVYSGGTPFMNAGISTYNNLTVSGGTVTAITATVSGTLSVTGGELSVPAAKTLTLNGPTNSVVGGTLSIASTGIVNAGSNPVNIGSDGILASSGTLNCGSFTSATTVTNPAQITNPGTNTINASGSVSITGTTFSAPANSTIHMTGPGTTLNAAATIGILNTDSGAGNTLALATNALTLAGNLVLTSGTLSDTGLGLSVAGNISHTLGKLTSTGTLTFNGGTAQTANLADATYVSSVANVTVNNANGVSFTNTAAVTWSGDCLLTAGALSLPDLTQTIGGNVTGSAASSRLNAIAITGANTLTVNGTVGTAVTALNELSAPTAANMNVAGNVWNVATFTANGGTIDFTGAVTRTIYSSSGFYNLTKSGSGTTAYSGAQISVANNLLVSAGILSLADYAGTQTITGTVTGTGTLDASAITGGTHILSVGGTIGTAGTAFGTLSAPATGGILNISGTDWNVGSLIHNAGTVAFTGTASQTVTTQAQSFNDLTLATRAGGTVTFTGALNVTNTLAVNGGAYIVTISNGGTTANPVTFNNTGALNLAAGYTFTGGVTHTAGTTNFTGTLTTVNSPVAFNALALTGIAGASNTITTVGGNIQTGAISNAATQNLDLIAGTGNIAITGSVGSGTALDTITITSANNTKFDSTVNATSIAQIAGTGTTTFGDNITTNGTAGIGIDIGTTTAPSSIVLDGLTATDNGTGHIYFRAPVTLSSAAVAVTAANGAIRFYSTIDGAQDLTIAHTTTNTTEIDGAIGATTTLSNLTVGGSTIDLYGIGSASQNGASGTVDVTGTGAVTLFGTALNGGNYRSVGAQTWTATTAGVRYRSAQDGTWSAGGTGATCAATDLYLDHTTGVTLTLGSALTCRNLFFYRGNLAIGSHTLETTADFVVFGGTNYNDNDPEWTGANTRYAYYHTIAPTWLPGSATYSAATHIITFNATTDHTANFTNLAGSTITVGGNFYDNGADMNTGAFTLNIPDNSGSSPAINTSNTVIPGQWGTTYAVAFNMAVSNSTAGTGWVAADSNQGVSHSGTNVNWQFARPTISAAATVYDDVIKVTFDINVENSHGEIRDALRGAIASAATSVSTGAVWYNSGATKFADAYSDPACAIANALPDGDTNTFYIKTATGRWNTDADGTNATSTYAGTITADSTDRYGVHQTTIPDLSFLKGLFHAASGKTMCANYGANGVAVYSGTADNCRPVLVEVRTGQEVHTAALASQMPYDAHNFVEFHWSEPVAIGGFDSLANFDATHFPHPYAQSQTTFSAGDWGGAISGTSGLTIAGYASIDAGSISTGSRGAYPGAGYTSGDTTVSGLYRFFSQNGGTAALQTHRLRISVAGWVDPSTGGNWFWEGFIDGATCPSGPVTVTSNSNITDRSAALNKIEPTVNDDPTYGATTYAKQAVSVTDNTTPSGLYSLWDTTAPSLAGLKSATGSWAGTPTYYEAIPTANASAQVNGIELHFFDNTVAYGSGTYRWQSRKGWYTGTDAARSFLAATAATAPESFGGARPDVLTATIPTSGGIRDISWTGSENAFTITNTAVSGSVNPTNITTTVDSPFMSPSGSNATDNNPYLKLNCTTAWPIATAKISLGYTKNTGSGGGCLTDLAGNRLETMTSLLCLDRSPPQITFTIASMKKNQIYVLFSKELDFPAAYLDGSTTYENGILVHLGSNTYTPVSAAQIHGSAQGILFTLDSAVSITTDELADSTNMIEVQSTGQITTDPDGFTINETKFRDLTGNYVSSSTTHRVTDIGLNIADIWYGSDGVNKPGLLDPNSDATAGALRTFDGSGRLLDRDITIATKLALASAPGALVLYFDANPPASVLPGLFNAASKSSSSLWLPSILPSFNALADQDARSLGQINTGSFNRNFLIPEADSEVIPGSKIEMVMQYNGLFCARLTNPDDITTVAPWSFRISETKKQRGGVTILNNVIDSKKREQTILQVTLAKAGNLTIEVFTMDGNLLKVLERTQKGGGTYTYTWDGTNKAGNSVARGIYFIRVVGPDMDEIRKVMVVKE